MKLFIKFRAFPKFPLSPPDLPEFANVLRVGIHDLQIAESLPKVGHTASGCEGVRCQAAPGTAEWQLIQTYGDLIKTFSIILDHLEKEYFGLSERYTGWFFLTGPPLNFLST